MVNCYLVSEGNQSILVDTGIEQYRDKVFELCAKAGVKLIVLTHGHNDHIQNAVYLSEKLKTPIAIHQADAELAGDNQLQPLQSRGALGSVLKFFSELSFKKTRCKDFRSDLFLKDGDLLTNYGVNARVVSLEGHTDGSIGLDIDEKYFLAGDALMNMFKPTAPRIFHNKEKMLESIRKISSLGNRTIYFGHGEPVQNRDWSC
jgi:glyoxylase-like metal-dependent hydrolase (beta-lactamase superfamily II)